MNPNKNYILRVNGTKKEVLKAIESIQLAMEDYDKYMEMDDSLIKGTVWSWKDDSKGELFAEIKK